MPHLKLHLQHKHIILYPWPCPRKANLYRSTTGSDYWSDLADLHLALGLGVRHKTALAIIPLTRYLPNASDPTLALPIPNTHQQEGP